MIKTSPSIFFIVLLSFACTNANRPIDIIGTWGTTIDSMYREYTFTTQNLIIYDDYFGAQIFNYNVQNDTITVLMRANTNPQRYYALSGSENKLRLMVEASRMADLTKIQTKIDFQKIVDGDESEFDKYVSDFNSRNIEQ